MVKTNVPSSNSLYKPHDFLKKAVAGMKDYCLPRGNKGIANPETGAIIAIILYLTAKEPNADWEKLECYVIMLDKLIKKATRQKLFHWNLNRKGFVSGFWRIFEHMIDKKLWKKNYDFHCSLLPKAMEIIQIWPDILNDLLPYMDKLLTTYNNYTAKKFLKDINLFVQETNKDISNTYFFLLLEGLNTKD